ncbi:MAG: hypothetical protein ABGY42_00680, partial [bacterium]
MTEPVPCFAVFDFGTGGGKCVIFDAHGKRRAAVRQTWSFTAAPSEYDDLTPGYSFDPHRVWATLAQCARTALKKALETSGLGVGVEIACRAIPFDGYDYGAPALSDPVTLQNLAPDAPVVSLSAPEGADGDATCVLAEVVEGLTYTYYWSVNGSDEVLGEAVRRNPAIFRRIGAMSEYESVYDFMTGRELVALSARLQGMDNVDAAVDEAIELVDLAADQNRRLGGYSRGMRQR